MSSCIKAIGTGLGSFPMSQYITFSLNNALFPIFLSNNACANLVFPTPDNPANLTTFRSFDNNSLISLIPSTIVLSF